MDNEGVHFVDVFSFLFVGATLAVARWAVRFWKCLTGDRKGRPYEHIKNIFRRKIPSLSIVHCPLSIRKKLQNFGNLSFSIPVYTHRKE